MTPQFGQSMTVFLPCGLYDPTTRPINDCFSQVTFMTPQLGQSMTVFLRDDLYDPTTRSMNDCVSDRWPLWPHRSANQWLCFSRLTFMTPQLSQSMTVFLPGDLYDPTSHPSSDCVSPSWLLTSANQHCYPATYLTLGLIPVTNLEMERHFELYFPAYTKIAFIYIITDGRIVHLS